MYYLRSFPRTRNRVPTTNTQCPTGKAIKEPSQSQPIKSNKLSAKSVNSFHFSVAFPHSISDGLVVARIDSCLEDCCESPYSLIIAFRSTYITSELHNNRRCPLQCIRPHNKCSFVHFRQSNNKIFFSLHVFWSFQTFPVLFGHHCVLKSQFFLCETGTYYLSVVGPLSPANSVSKLQRENRSMKTKNWRKCFFMRCLSVD